MDDRDVLSADVWLIGVLGEHRRELTKVHTGRWFGAMSVRATGAERAAARPGDDLAAPADVVMDRAFTVAAPPEEVWPWLVQLGKRRAGWYLPARGQTEVSWSISLNPTGPGRTRVSRRLRLAPIRHLRLVRTFGEFFDWLTIAGMAAGLRERAEQSGKRGGGMQAS